MDSGGLGGFPRNAVVEGDCRALIPALPDESIDVVVSSPPYWGQRTSAGNGVEADPRRYVAGLARRLHRAAAEGETPRRAVDQHR